MAGHTYNATESIMKTSTTLKEGAILHNTYTIERVLGQGGFGITYLAIDTSLDRKVAIKEFFPKDFCDREGDTSLVRLGTQNTTETVSKLKTKFLKEAKNIAKFDHPGIIRIISAFEENNTAYYVMDFIEGESLSAMVKRIGKVQEEKALNYIKKIGYALKYMHEKHMTHLDVKPANIMVRQIDDEPILIDFGLSKQYDTDGHQTSTTPAGISHGYAPLEQYRQGGVSDFSPQTDIYSLAATLYKLITGITPPDATDIVNNGLECDGISNDCIWRAISKAMSISKKSRYANIEEFINALECSRECYEKNQNSGTDESTIIQKFSKNEEYKHIDEKTSSNEVPMREEESASEVNVDYWEEDIPIWKKTWFVITLIIIGLIVLICIGYSSGCNRLGIESDATDSNIVLDTIVDGEREEVEANNNDMINQYGNDKDKERIDGNEENNSHNIKILESDNKRNEQGAAQEKQLTASEGTETTVHEPVKTSQETVYVAAEQQAEFPGGMSALMGWLSNNIQYPPIAQQNDVQGRVIVRFIVSKDGSIRNAEIVKGVDKDLDSEALRIVRMMPKWNPAKNEGVVVNSYYILPITFRLTDNNNSSM